MSGSSSVLERHLARAARRTLPLVILSASVGACIAHAPRTLGTPTTATAAPPAPGPFAKVLVATWNQTEQRSLEAAAKAGLAVFASSGGRFVLLPECRMAGQYRYFGIKPRRQHVVLGDARQIDVNVAVLNGAAVVAPPLEMDLVRVGRLTTTRRTGEDAALLGSCHGASHFARTLSVGEVVGAAAAGPSTSTCLGAPLDQSLPSPACRHFLRAELVALTNAKLDTANGSISFCPPGWALSEGVCVERMGAKAYDCRDDPSECRAQCDRGNGPSCTRLGYLIAHGERGFVRNERQALSFYERACTLGHPAGCFNAGVMHALDGTHRQDETLAASYWDQACSDGYPAACSNLGLLRARDRAPAERERAVSLLGRACAGGDPVGCLNAAVVLRRAGGATAEPEVGHLLDLACDGDVANACLELAGWLSAHGATAQTARAALDKACRLGSTEACASAPNVQQL